jgi:hypothetical protein
MAFRPRITNRPDRIDYKWSDMAAYNGLCRKEQNSNTIPFNSIGICPQCYGFGCRRLNNKSVFQTLCNICNAKGYVDTRELNWSCIHEFVEVADNNKILTFKCRHCGDRMTGSSL